MGPGEGRQFSGDKVECRLAGQQELAAAGTETAQAACGPSRGDPINMEGLLPSKIRFSLEDNAQLESMRKTLKV